MEKLSFNFTPRPYHDCEKLPPPQNPKEIAVEHKCAVFEICLATIKGLKKEAEAFLEVIQVAVMAYNYDNQGWGYDFVFTAFLRDPFGSKEKIEASHTCSVPYTVSERQIPFMRDSHSEVLIREITRMMGLRAREVAELAEMFDCYRPQKATS